MKAIKLIILSAFLFSVHSCIAQQRQNEKTKLQQFFQQNADSTIILGFDKVLLEPAKYLIFSKHADTISAFYYGLVGETPENVPVQIRRKLKQLRVSASTLPVDINSNFHVKALSLEKGRKLWNNLALLKPWKLDDDKTIGEGCKGSTIYDGHGLSLYLVTAEDIKHLYFYEPKIFLEKKCPGENERRRMIEIESIFTGFFEPKE